MATAASLPWSLAAWGGAWSWHLEHGADVRVLGLHQLPPGGEVAVGEDAPRLQQAKRVALGGGQRSGRERVARGGPCVDSTCPDPAGPTPIEDLP